MGWIKTGSVTVTNGSATVTGSGTFFVDVGTCNAGDIFCGPDGKQYEILSVVSNTGLTLASNYLGTSLGGQAYAIYPIGLLPSTLAQQVKATLTTANNALASTVRYDINSMGLSLVQQQNARTNIAALSALDVGAGYLTKSVAGGVDVTLTAVEASAQMITLTGAITANINVIVPVGQRLFFIQNSTSGAFTVTIKTPSGSGVFVASGYRAMLASDGTNVINPFTQSVGNMSIVGAIAATDQISVVKAGSNTPLFSARYNAANFMMGIGIANSNGFPYLGVNVNSLAASDAGTFDINGWARRIRMESGFLQFERSSVSGTAGGTITWVTDLVQDSAGNLLVGTGSGSSHVLTKAGSEGTLVAYIRGATGGLTVYESTSGGANAAASAIKLEKNSSTLRSINAGGTINASGADYAEYEHNNGLAIAKGDIVGFKADGTLTLTFSDSVRFGIKSTSPSYVGGDTWGSEEVVGQRPIQPEQDADQSSYLAALARWAAALEAARQRVDRIAYSGKVPCNVIGATPGHYIVATAAPDGGITGQSVAAPDLSNYMASVGRVNRILPDGRCEVAVLVH